jgi:hypothetical protein
VRVPTLELLSKHFPDRVFNVVEPLLEPTSYDARPTAERVAIWRAVGSSTQPEALYAIAGTLRQKASFLTRARIEAVKLEALEGLALMRTRPGEELLKELAADASQPDSVRAAAVRILATPVVKVPPAPPPVVPIDLRRWDKTLATPRAFLRDLLSLSQAARISDVTAPALAIAFHRLRVRLGLLLRQVPRFEVAVSGRTVTFNGAPVLEGQPDIPMEQLAATMARDGITGFAFDSHVKVEELRELVRWLAEGPAARGVYTPNIRRGRASPHPEQPTRPVTRPPVLVDPSREAMIRYVDLVLELREYLTTVTAAPTARPGDLQRLLDELAMAMETRAYRFLGLTPREVGRDSVAFHHANVAILALGFAAELRLPRARLLELAEVACLHDLGMFLLPERVVLNSGELSHADKEALLKARLASAWFPFERLDTGARAARWAAAVMEYGLDWGAVEDGDRLVQRQEVGLIGGILALAKSYDALTSRRSFREAAPPEAAPEQLTTRARHRFRPDLLPLFAAWVRRHWVRVLPVGR